MLREEARRTGRVKVLPVDDSRRAHSASPGCGRRVLWAAGRQATGVDLASRTLFVCRRHCRHGRCHCALAAFLTGQPIDLVRAALGLAASGAVISPALLIADLGRPTRFLNMLRVFKWRSPMSMGVWILVLIQFVRRAGLPACRRRSAFSLDTVFPEGLLTRTTVPLHAWRSLVRSAARNLYRRSVGRNRHSRLVRTPQALAFPLRNRRARFGRGGARTARLAHGCAECDRPDRCRRWRPE